ncbi:hypothetical protein BDQ94DRAFT_163981 [Aspergillus welwitschiae]|uniref:Uncharacterized protein n=1 Tax=Aspergillus welwitschiae TaxID=1341132 RepID=A0A3F3PJI3_9EURO|nr:hypothetical protein BDQ94DRAFT_163981 [Aspergillus welwitschiae]RDH27037.1 hypothetical protein BDQ94DRAFT_163981 [Aspergillus welwitschiae]
MIENVFNRLEEFHESLLQLKDFEEEISTIFMLISFASVSKLIKYERDLPVRRITYNLVENTQEYLRRQAFLLNWILRDFIRRTVVKLLLNTSTRPFL